MAQLWVVVSDSRCTDGQLAFGYARIRRPVAAACGVLWIALRQDAEPTDGHPVALLDDPTTAARRSPPPNARCEPPDNPVQGDLHAREDAGKPSNGLSTVEPNTRKGTRMAGQYQDQPADDEIERLVAEQQEATKAHIATSSQKSWDADELHPREEEALYENCRVRAFYDDPITREASLDARELQTLAPKCDCKGCRRDRELNP